jgi:HlyD family type I secretion membrane fusion protein
MPFFKKPKQRQADDIPFLETAPPPLAARGLSYIIITLFIAASLASVLIEVPESVSGPFTLVPVNGTDPVRSPEDGYVSRVFFHEGQNVKKDQALFVIQSEEIGNRTSDYQTSRSGLKGSEQRLESLKKEYDSKRLAQEEEQRRLDMRVAYLQKMIALKRDQLKLTQDTLDSYGKLNQEGIASNQELTTHKLEVNKITLELQDLETEFAEAQAMQKKQKHQMEEDEAERAQLQQTIVEEQEKNKIRMDTVSRELTNSKENEQSILSPCTGSVLRLHMRSAFSVVEQGDILAELACSGEHLQAEVTVPQTGLARIRSGQGVKLLYDAFPYQRYGVRFGNVQWVSAAGVAEQNRDAVFPVRVELKEQSIKIKGRDRELIPGMRGTAQIVVDRRSLLSYAFAPVRQLKEMMASPPENQK